MQNAPGRVVLDLRDVGRDNRGVSRSLREIGRRLLEHDPERYFAVCSKQGVELLPADARDCLVVVPPHSQAVFEQLTLPSVAKRLGAEVVYSFRECGAIWGPPLLLHVTEDPELRWERYPPQVSTPAGRAKDLARRRYSRILMNRALQRARVVTCTHATALDLERRHRLPADQVTIVPLGIDLEQFRAPARGSRLDTPYFFHLSSDDPREGTAIVVDAFARFVRSSSDPIRLVVAGDLGSKRRSLLEQQTARLGISDRVEMPGRVTDDCLVELYSASVATVIASTNEGFGLQPVEAMACGSLLVAAPAPATKEIAAGAEVEWTAAEAEPMAAAFAAVRHDAARRDRATTVNRAVASKFSWDATAQSLDEILRDMTRGEIGDQSKSRL